MELNEINGVAFKTQSGDDPSGSAGLTETFDNFLMLLTTQLQNQDPLSPLDTNQFTEQLVQFSGVEQSIRTNDKLDDLIALQSGNQMSAAVGYIGKSVKAESSRLSLQDGQATIVYGLAENAATTSIVISDDAGRTLRVLAGETTAGLKELTWDGTDGLGNDQPDGIYNLQVNALDAEGQLISVATGVIGRVTGIELVDNELLLEIGDLLLPLDKVIAVGEDDDQPPAS